MSIGNPAEGFQKIFDAMFESVGKDRIRSVVASIKYGEAIEGVIPFSTGIVMAGEINAVIDESVGGEASVGFSGFGASLEYSRGSRAGMTLRVTARWGFNSPLDVSNDALDTAALFDIFDNVPKLLEFDNASPTDPA